MKGSIASTTWEACKTCRRHSDDGCYLEGQISLSIELGDWVICDDYYESNSEETSND